MLSMLYRFSKPIQSCQIKYPNDSNIAHANYYFLGPEVRELFEIRECAKLIEGANYYRIFWRKMRELFETRQCAN